MNPASRRNFLKTTALGTAALSFAKTNIFAGPFNFDGVDFLIPEDKKLSQEWINSLYNRGEAELYKLADDELKYIGMPVGGIASGQLYLAGDGRLRLWHIFKVTYSREKDHGQRFDAMTLGGHYAEPDKAFARETRPVDQGSVIRITGKDKTWVKRLDSRDFSDISFRGEYPIGKVEYNSEDLPVKVKLEAFSPFIPNNAEESALPATILDYQITNESSEELEVDLLSWLENAVLPYSNSNLSAVRRSTLSSNGNRTSLLFTPEGVENETEVQEDIVFEDFESGSYNNWTASGEAFGLTPFPADGLKHWQPLNGYQGNLFVNTHNSRSVSAEQQTSAGAWASASDQLTGMLTSKEFTIDRNYINFLIGGGSHSSTAIHLLVDGEVVRSASGSNSNSMRAESFDVSEFLGQKAMLRLVDNYTGGWGHISLDHIVFSDTLAGNDKVEDQHGFGSMAISVIDNSENDVLVSFDFNTQDIQQAITDTNPLGAVSTQNITKPIADKSVGALGRTFKLAPGESKSVKFLLSWFFPYLNQQDLETGQLLALKDIRNLNRHYFKRFNSALQVADHIQLNSDDLISTTKLWNKTWYDSSLPYWLLDRSFIPNDCLASNTVVWFDNGRFWGWEGVECCPGTCQHVWHYAQGMSRIFPEIERYLREEIDFGSGLNANGSMSHRDETAGGYGAHPAHDGHCGTIIRAYREHRMSTDDSFLKRNYLNIKKAIQFIIDEDKDKDGLLEGGQTNTLDASWYGPMGWISSLYLGALAVGKEMALEMEDNSFAAVCNNILKKGQRNIVSDLFNGEYFIHKPDTAHPNSINSNDGCLIDQVLGQSLALQAGLDERVIPEIECKSALNSIWKYNFAPDAYLYQKNHKPIKGARIYATEGEAGTLMCTWPKGGAENAVPGMANWPDESETWLGPGGYFDECMNGFEYQVASHLIFEGEVEKGLALTKSVHERYGASKRNPFNEIECGDHYSRSMAAYGVFIAVCGFKYHGPKGELTLAPKITIDNFKAPFTSAEAWGTISQNVEDKKFITDVDLKYGKLNLQSLNFNVSGKQVQQVEIKIGDTKIDSTFSQQGDMLKLSFDPVVVEVTDNMLVTSIFSNRKKLGKAKVTIYPNPFMESIQIDSQSELNEMSIFDLNGKKVYDNTEHFYHKETNLAFLPKGIYVLKLQGKEGISTTKITKA